jgi:hypothetical protein
MAMTLLTRMQKSVEPGSKLPGTLLEEHNSFEKLRAFFGGWANCEIAMLLGDGSVGKGKIFLEFLYANGVSARNPCTE